MFLFSFARCRPSKVICCPFLCHLFSIIILHLLFFILPSGLLFSLYLFFSCLFPCFLFCISHVVCLAFLALLISYSCVFSKFFLWFSIFLYHSFFFSFPQSFIFLLGYFSFWSILFPILRSSAYSFSSFLLSFLRFSTIFFLRTVAFSVYCLLLSRAIWFHTYLSLDSSY